MKKKKLSKYKKLYAEEEALTLFLYDSISPNIPFSKLPEENQKKIMVLGRLVKEIKDNSNKFIYKGALLTSLKFLNELNKIIDLIEIKQEISRLRKEIKKC